MDRTSIIVLIVCFIVLVLWYPLVVNKLYPPKPVPVATNAVPSVVGATNRETNYQIEATTPASSTANSLVPIINTNEPEQLLVVTNDNARYTFTSHGGGLKLIELVKYPDIVPTRREKRPETNRFAMLNSFTRAPTLAVLGGDALHGDGGFKLTRTEDGVRAEKDLANGLSIVKEFRPTTNYLVQATVRLENHSSQPIGLPAQEWVVGTATPLNAKDDGQATGVLWYDGTKLSDDIGAGFFSSSGFACIPRTPPAQYVGGMSNVVWVAPHNQFFALAAMPDHPAQALVVRKVDLPRPTGEEALLVNTNRPAPHGYEAALVYPSVTLAANQKLERQIFLYAGPKEYQTLARIADRFNNNVDSVMNFGRWFGFVSKALLLSMNWLHSAMKLPYGWAIIAITVVIKLIFWPLTQASTRSTKRMQALQPQMNAIREKYKDDPVKMNRKVMEYMKENKVSPLGGCLPMLLQIPVFFGFYTMIRSAIELRGSPFLWVGDLSQPDTLFLIPGLGGVPFIGIPGAGLPFNLLPLIMGATMLWQARLTPPSPGMDPAQAKLMRYMPLMFMVFLYNFSAGLTLYWTVQNLLTIAQTKLTRTVEISAPAKGPVLTAQPKKRK